MDLLMKIKRRPPPRVMAEGSVVECSQDMSVQAYSSMWESHYPG